jgi:hypothetical protein
LSAFLEIEMLPVLLQPTVAGLPAASNSSFTGDSSEGAVHGTSLEHSSELLGFLDRIRLRSILGRRAALLEYALPAPFPRLR